MKSWLVDSAVEESRRQTDVALVALLEAQAENERLKSQIADYETRIVRLTHKLAELEPAPEGIAE